MPALDNLGLPALDAVLAGAAGLVNSIHLPAATPASVAAGLAAVPCLLALAWLARRLTARPGAEVAPGSQLDEICQRLQATSGHLMSQMDSLNSLARDFVARVRAA